MQHSNARLSAGFTLLEMSVVLVIVATLVGAGIAVATSKIAQEQEDITRQRMAAIQKTLLDYRRVFDSLPCPAIAGAAIDDAAFGRGTSLQPIGGSCNDDYPPSYSTGDVWGGSVPVRTLKLPDEYAFDGWGRRFLYFVDEEATGQGAFQALGDITASVGDITIMDLTGATIESNALYMLLSHGPNGHGAISRGGSTAVSSFSENSFEQDNCGCNVSGVNTGFDADFHTGPYTDTSIGTYVNYFDDIVVFGTRRSLRNLWE
ncbi:MAG: type II secretion system protein [Alphaproteobacteria bacterium]